MVHIHFTNKKKMFKSPTIAFANQTYQKSLNSLHPNVEANKILKFNSEYSFYSFTIFSWFNLIINEMLTSAPGTF